MRHHLLQALIIHGLVLLPLSLALAGEADVIDVRVRAGGDGTYRFDVTVRSNDTGWDYYADAFEILAPDDTLLGRRILHHPHENEQPFTRSLGNVEIPPEIGEVTVRARHNPAGYDGETLTVTLP
jgi:hypothetical protein